MSSIWLGEENESRVDTVCAERLDQTRYREQVGQSSRQCCRPTAAVDEGSPRRHQMHHLRVGTKLFIDLFCRTRLMVTSH